MEKESSKATYILLAIIAVVTLGLFFYFQGTPNDDATSSLTSVGTDGSANAQEVGARVINILNQINSLKIDGEIFSDPAYMTLVDYTITVPEQNVGRPNPFAPLPGGKPATPAK